MTLPLCDLTASALLTRLHAHEITAAQILDSVIERITAVEGGSGTPRGDVSTEPDGVHAYIAPLALDSAREQAAALDQRIADGEPIPPLAGIPFAVKDVFNVKGMTTTAASYILHNYRAVFDATVIERLRAAGAIVVGKANLDEFALGSSSESSQFRPRPRNPWNRAHVPGGSSGGSAAAVAAGEAVLALGSDTAGSIRQPAAFCGVVGMKPTYGRVSRWGLLALSSSLDCVGPVARSVRDCALMLGAMAGPDRRDWTAAALPVPDYAAAIDGTPGDLKGVRIGIAREYLDEQFMPHDESAAVRRAFDEACAVLRDRGAVLIDISLPHTAYGIPVYFIVSRIELASNLHRYDGVKFGYRAPGEFDGLLDMYEQTRTQGFDKQPKQRILMGMHASSVGFESDDDRENMYRRALKFRTLIRRDFEEAFKRVDIIAAPTTPSTAFRAGDPMGNNTVAMQNADRLVVNANHAGIPAISVPCGFDGGGLPIGLQFIAPDWEEARLLTTAHAYEQAAGWHTQRPRRND